MSTHLQGNFLCYKNRMAYWDLKIGSHYRKTSEKELLGEEEQEERDKIEKYMKNHCKTSL